MKAGTESWRVRYWGDPCRSDRFETIQWTPDVRLHIDGRAREAFEALAKLLRRHEYRPLPEQTGSYNCRKVSGSRAWSSHAWGIAVDINWQRNPIVYGRDRWPETDFPPEMIADIQALRTAGGARVWRWGGDWDGDPNTGEPNYDAMHFEIIATPDQLANGLAPLPDPADRYQPSTLPALKRGARGPLVAVLQDRLDVGGPAIFGPATEAAVRAHQTYSGLVVDGIVGPATWASVLAVKPEPVEPDPETELEEDRGLAKRLAEFFRYYPETLKLWRQWRDR